MVSGARVPPLGGLTGAVGFGARRRFADAPFEVASAQGNGGLSTGITGPSTPPLAEAMFPLDTRVGRLEINPVFVLLRSLLFGMDP